MKTSYQKPAFEIILIHSQHQLLLESPNYVYGAPTIGDDMSGNEPYED